MDAWLKAIEDDGLPWIQVSDLKGWENEAALLYGVRAIPQNFLVDPDGTIIAVDLRGKALTERSSATVSRVLEGLTLSAEIRFNSI